MSYTHEGKTRVRKGEGRAIPLLYSTDATVSVTRYIDAVSRETTTTFRFGKPTVPSNNRRLRSGLVVVPNLLSAEVGIRSPFGSLVCHLIAVSGCFVVD